MFVLLWLQSCVIFQNLRLVCCFVLVFEVNPPRNAAHVIVFGGRKVKRNEVQYKIPLKILSYKELYGWSMDEIVKEIGTKNNCTFCGVFRRQALDRGAALMNANKVATGMLPALLCPVKQFFSSSTTNHEAWMHNKQHGAACLQSRDSLKFAWSSR